MSEFSVNTGKLDNFSDFLEEQAQKIESAGVSVNEVKSNLGIHGSARTPIMSSMKSISGQIKKESSTAKQMSRALREIAAAYRSAENRILGKVGGLSGMSTTSGGGSGDSSSNGSTNGNKTDSSIYSSDPVNLNTGNLILDNHDMEIPGSDPLRLGRFYNSMGTFAGMLGADWMFCYEMHLSFDQAYRVSGADVCVMLGDGREEYFASRDGKSYHPVTATTAKLARTENGYQYEELDGNVSYFNEDGKYVRFENTHKIGFDLTYDGDKLIQVKKDSGEFFEFIYDASGILESVKDHAGRTCRYIFEEEHLKSVVLPDGGAYQYFYHPHGKISRVVNPRKVDAVETEYDERMRVTFQKFADGTTNQFEYLDAENAVIMTERNGSKSIHYHNEKYQNIRNVYLDGEESFAYNGRDQKTVIKDKLGNVTRLQYDNRGNLTGILTADDTKIFATYNPQNRLLTMSVNGKSKVRNQYDSFGDLICTEDGLGRKTSYTYDEAGRLTKIQAPDGSEIKAFYDERGNLIRAINTDGGEFVYEYDELNQMIHETNPLGQNNAYTYDVAGRLLTETRADGCCRSNAYDEWGNLVSVKDFDGNVLYAAYNENNRITSMTDSLGRTFCYEYDAMWNVAKTILPGGRIFQYHYNENNALESVQDANGNESHFAYDPMGNLISETNAKGATTVYNYDDMGRCIKRIAPDGVATEFGYDEEDHIVYVKDALGVELFRSFDDAGQLTEERDSLGQKRCYEYNEMGEILSLVDEKGRKTVYRYAKGSSLPEKIIFPDGTAERYAYDLCGNKTSFTNIYGETISYEYDVLNRMVAQIRENGDTTAYRYDLLGRLTERQDFDGSVTKFEYTAAGQLAAVIDALGNRTEYEYNETDELMRVLKTIPGQEKTVWQSLERDRMGRITKVTDALGKSESYQYDSLGRITARTDRDGLDTKYVYNFVNLLQMIQWADGKTASYKYDRLRRISEVQDWTGTTKIAYDALGKVTKIVYPDEREYVVDYDAAGNRSRMQYPDGTEVFCEYDGLGRMMKLTRGTDVFAYSYNQTGGVASRSLPDGGSVQYDYDRQGLVSKMTYCDSQGVVDDFSYGYDSYGRRTSYEVARRDAPTDNGVYGYCYDPAGRLKEILKEGRPLRQYDYDAFGNRTGMTSFDPLTHQKEFTGYEYNLRNGLIRMTKPGLTEEYRYDGRGNLTELLKNGKAHKTYSYNAMNRLSGVQSADGGEAAYRYNGLGYRIGREAVLDGKKKTVAYTQDYSRVYDNLLEMAENDGQEDYIWGIGLEGFAASGISGWYLTDSLGSVLRKRDCTGVVSTGHYDEFGVSRAETDTEFDSFGYNGFLFDPVAGTYFAQARQYRSYTGTFDAMDRFGGDITMPETLNPYSYCVQDPFSHTDKTAYWFGLDDLIAAGIGAAGGLAGQLISDVVDYATTGTWDSSWQEYAGAAVGGAAGGVTTLYAGPIAGGAVSGGVSRLTTEGLTYVSNPSGYQKSFGDVMKETAIDTGLGALSGAVSKLAGKAAQKIAGSRVGTWLTSKLGNLGKAGNWLANKITDIAHGKSGRWSQWSKYLKNQHGTIANSEALKKKLFSSLLKLTPAFLGGKLLSTLTDKLNPVKILWSNLKDTFSEQLKKWFGIDDGNSECAAAA